MLSIAFILSKVSEDFTEPLGLKTDAECNSALFAINDVNVFGGS